MIRQRNVLGVGQLLHLLQGDVHLFVHRLNRAFITGAAQSEQKSKDIFGWAKMV